VGSEEEGGGRDAGFWVLIAIAVVTAVCAVYSLLVASGVLGGA
jgi:amino acid permease